MCPSRTINRIGAHDSVGNAYEPDLSVRQSDVSDGEAIAELHRQVLAEFPRLNVLVRRHEKPFLVSDMRPGVRPRDAYGQTIGVRIMLHQGETAESRIKVLIEAWADAVRRHDFSGILAHHDQDVVMFDVPPPLQSRGMDEYKKIESTRRVLRADARNCRNG